MGSTPKTGEFRGKTLEAAIAAGLQELGLARNEVEIEVIRPGSRGVLGIGAEDAVVRLTQRMKEPSPPAAPSPAAPGKGEQAEKAGQPEVKKAEAPPVAPTITTGKEEIAQTAQRLLLETLRKMGLPQADVRIRWEQEPDQPNQPPTLVLDIVGKDLGILIGRRGETLADLQYILRLMVNQATGKWEDLVVDVEEYKARRERNLQQLARRMAEQAVSTGRIVKLEPMPPAERRIIHLTLRDHAQVTTVSEGEGEHRKVTIVPKKSRTR